MGPRAFTYIIQIWTLVNSHRLGRGTQTTQTKSRLLLGTLLQWRQIRDVASSSDCAVIPRNNEDTNCLCVNGRCPYTSSMLPTGKNVREYSCECDPGWIGSDCSVCCNKPCVHGFCMMSSGEMTCVCDGRHGGEHCELEIVLEATSKCAVVPRKKDPNCPTYVCVHGRCSYNSFVALAGGQKERTYDCWPCDPGWTGRQCNVCCNKPCVHGRCEKFYSEMQCTCDDRYTGDLCETEIELGPTTELDTKRTCHTVHRISNGCEENSGTERLPFPCQNGVCVPDPDKRRVKPFCKCDYGWTGDLCDICCPQPCGNGTCVVEQEQMKCQCNWGYSGEYCERLTDTEVPIPWGVVTTSVAVSAAVVLILLLMLYRARRKRVGRQHVSLQSETENPASTYTFDAFISYRSTEEDERFVEKTLVPKLEKKKYRVCVHYRNFLVGAAIADNIIDAVYSSHKTILLLSPSYVESEWTRLEYQVAQHQMLKARHKIIPIVFRDITHVKLDKNLKFILSSVTYLEWPGFDSPEEDDFWKSLDKAMRGRKSRDAPRINHNLLNNHDVLNNHDALNNRDAFNNHDALNNDDVLNQQDVPNNQDVLNNHDVLNNQDVLNQQYSHDVSINYDVLNDTQ